MIFNQQYLFLKSYKMIGLFFLCSLIHYSFAQNLPVKSIEVKNATQPLPHAIFFQLIDSTESFILNHQTEFKHIDIPKKFYNQFTAYIKDSVAVEVKGLKSLVYYNYKFTNGKYINGDIYWDNKNSYIVFKIEGKTYVNYFTNDGVQQIKKLFKL